MHDQLTTKLTPLRLSFELLRRYELEIDIDPILAMELYTVIADIYASAFEHGQRLPRVVIDFAEETILVAGWSDEATCLSMIRNSLGNIEVSPKDWVVSFAQADDDCWLDDFVFLPHRRLEHRNTYGPIPREPNY